MGRSARSTWWITAATVVMMGALASCSGSDGSDGASADSTVPPAASVDTTAAPTTAAPSTTAAPTTTLAPAPSAADVEAICAPMFDAWSTGDDHALLGLMTPTASAVLDEHPFGLGFFGMHGGGTDCFIAGFDDLGALASVAEVIVGFVNGTAAVTAIDWRDLADVDPATLDRFDAAPVLFAPSLEGSDPGDAADADPGILPTLTGDDLIAFETLADSCVYQGVAASCDQLTATYGVDATSNFGLGNSLTQAPDEDLARQCAFEFRSLACSELRTRLTLGPDDEAIGRQFVDAVIAGDTAALATLAQPWVLDMVAIGPFDPATQDGVDIPGYSFFAGDSSFAFTAQATVFFNCWVGNGLVQYCQFGGE